MEKKQLKKYTWDEVKKHCRTDDCWVVVQSEVSGCKKGLVLDVTEWVPKHPGGDIIYDGAGGDVTIQFWSYHPLSFIDHSSLLLNKFVIGEIENYQLIYNIDTPFYRALKTRVEEKIKPQDRRGDYVMWFKSLVLCLTMVYCFWYGWIKGSMPHIVGLGLAISQSGLNIMHDGIHLGYAKNTLICNVAAFVFNIVGCNFVTYRRAHAFGHHAYTNHLEYDTGVTGAFPILRLHYMLPRSWFHLFQHIYGLCIYLASLLLFVVFDYNDLFTLFNYPLRYCPPSKKQWMITVAGKVIYLSWFFGHFLLFPFQKALLDCVIVFVLSGFCGLVFFVVNHWTDKAIQFSNEELKTHTNDWAILQVLASSNFAINSKLWMHLSGGLNLQIEHHLFPSLTHTRLFGLVPILRETCREFGINYDAQCFPSFWSALLSNFMFLRELGRGKFQSRGISISSKKTK